MSGPSDSLAAELADGGLTPAFVCDLDVLGERAARLRRTVGAGELFYSMKANPHPVVAAEVSGLGLGLDVSSAAEARCAAAVVSDPDHDLLLTGPGKAEPDIVAFREAGGAIVSVESRVELDRVAAAYARSGTRAQVMLRVATEHRPGRFGRGRGGHFGMDHDHLADILVSPAATGGSPGAVIAGFHFFPGSNMTEAGQLIASIERSIAVASRHLGAIEVDAPIVDLGGGFPAAFGTDAQPDPFDEVATHLHEVPDRLATAAGGRAVRVLYEAGRAVVGPAGALVTTVLDVKRFSDRTVVVLESGVNHLVGSIAVSGRPVRHLDLRVVRRTDAGPLPRGGEVDLVGPLCAPFDVLARGLTCEVPRPGDTIVLPSVGAYGATAGMVGFLSRPPATEVFTRAGAIVAADRMVLRREPVRAGAGPTTGAIVHDQEVSH